jgi:hypothetical protein
VRIFERNFRHGTIGTEFLARILGGNGTEFGTKYVNEQEKCPSEKLAQIKAQNWARNLSTELWHGIIREKYNKQFVFFLI